MDLIFATNNQHKANEIKAVVPPIFNIITLKEAGIDIEIAEPYATLEENAAEKGRTIYSLLGKNCFSEDTGLEVRALNGEPGVKSARYAGEGSFSQNNIEKLLANLKSSEDRSAQFRTIIFLLIDNKEYFFEGICRGQIKEEPKGNEGFGYDPIFTPDGADKTFGEMSMAEKNQFSHRKKAMDKLVTFLNQL